ncbi:MAG: hypothetical protein COZ17_11530 [Flavobacteriaceae bacterium CG_4_10_14_3_um_filter_33_47]|nr:MAG: hypothetical protein COZ17_11530 [Flavobacteriaceae bacterium CG_4_10_14_3_um_filter_33_47]PJB18195.1 MAG: hypothetical protein CO117_08920 [Flavobacteriaceae bacterium CG_4_9_14_3_um_filter_33_16]
MAVSAFTLAKSKQVTGRSKGLDVTIFCFGKNKCLTLNFKKMKNLENFSVQELNAKEIKNTNGGFLGILIAAVIIIAAGIFANDGNNNTQTYIDGDRVGN